MLTLYGVYVLCLALVWSYAHARFGTPEEYRFTTRPGPYWWSYVGYVTCTFFLFLALCFVLSLPAVRQALFAPALPAGVGLDPKVMQFALALPVPLAAGLAISVLLPKFPLLRKWDEALLAQFREWANIPGEMHELAGRLQPKHLTLTPGHVEAVRAFVESEERVQDPGSLAEHLRVGMGIGFEQSQYRFTRVMHVFASLKQLSVLPRYSRFFRQRPHQFERIEAEVWAFALRSRALLTLAREVHAYEVRKEFTEVLAERREIYKQECAAVFKPAAELMAYALLRAETTDEAVEARLREIGFTSEPPEPAPFPINDLTLLAVALLAVFLAVGGPFAPRLFPSMPDGSPAPASAVMGAFIVAAHMLATLATVGAILRVGVFRRVPGARPPAFACVCWAVFCAAASWCLCAAFGWAMGMGLHTPFIWLMTALNAVLALTLAYLCCGGLEGAVPARWLQPVEAVAGAAAMAFTGWITAWQLGLEAALSPEQHARLHAVTVALPGLVGLLLGGFVPKLVRAARTAGERRGPARHMAAPPERPVRAAG